MFKNPLSIRKSIIPFFVCVLFIPLAAFAGGHGGMTGGMTIGMTMGGYSGLGMGMMYGYGSFPSYSVNQAAWNMGSYGLYSGFPLSSPGYGSSGVGYGSLGAGYGSLYSSYPGAYQFGGFMNPSYGMSYGSPYGGYSPGYGFGYTWGGSMGGGSMGGSESGSGSMTYSTGSGASSGSDRTVAAYSGQLFYGSVPVMNPLMYGLFVGWI